MASVYPETYDDTNKIVDEEITREEISQVYGGTWTNLKRTVTETRFRYVGMSYAVAADCEAAMVSAGKKIVQLYRENDAGFYGVRVTDVTYGAWGAA